MDVKIEGDVLKLELPLDKEGQLSGSGKSKVHFTTHGFANVPGSDMRMSINIISKK